MQVERTIKLGPHGEIVVHVASLSGGSVICVTVDVSSVENRQKDGEEVSVRVVAHDHDKHVFRAIRGFKNIVKD